MPEVGKYGGKEVGKVEGKGGKGEEKGKEEGGKEGGKEENEDKHASLPGVKGNLPAFWRSMYKYDEVSGTDYVSGWVNFLFPYLKCGPSNWFASLNDSATAEKIVFDMEYEEWVDFSLKINEHGKIDFCQDYRIHTIPSDFPLGVSKTNFTWLKRDTKLSCDMCGGFAGTIDS